MELEKLREKFLEIHKKWASPDGEGFYNEMFLAWLAWRKEWELQQEEKVDPFPITEEMFKKLEESGKDIPDLPCDEDDKLTE